MTTTQNVTELQPRMTREQLIDATRKAAPLLPAASQWLMNELANRYDVQAVVLCESMEQRKALAIENTALRETRCKCEELQSQNADMAVQLANAESKCRELAEFKSRVYAQMGAGCDAPEFAITEGLNNLHRFADTLHSIEREFFTKEVSDEECEGETVEECPLCWGMTVEQYVSEFGKCLAEVRASGAELAGEYLKQYAQGLHEEARLVLQDAGELCNGFSAKLRTGVAA